jgi:hypothetical protein
MLELYRANWLPLSCRRPVAGKAAKSGINRISWEAADSSKQSGNRTDNSKSRTGRMIASFYAAKPVAAWRWRVGAGENFTFAV